MIFCLIASAILIYMSAQSPFNLAALGYGIYAAIIMFIIFAKTQNFKRDGWKKFLLSWEAWLAFPTGSLFYLTRMIVDLA